MNIQILECIAGAKEAKGLTVVIDVFRAFSLEAYLMAAGAKEIFAVGKETTARLLKMQHEDYLLVGERKGIILPGFDYGNSPSQMKNCDLMGRSVIHTTSAGTQGLVNAKKADEIITGSLVNARAIAKYICQRNPKDVSLVAMGLMGKERAQEDYLCARYIKSLIEGHPLNLQSELQELRKDSQTQKFFDPDTQHIFPAEDYSMCTDYDKFDFVLHVESVEKDIFRVTV